MTFEEVDIGGEVQHTSSYTCLKEYCTSDYWIEEAERFKRKRKSFELEVETGLEKDARHQEMLSDSWIDIDISDTDTDEAEVQVLEDAYRVMSKMTAEYLMVERAAAKYSKYAQPALHNRALPTLVPGVNRKQRPQGNNLTDCSKGQDLNIPKPNFMATVFKESTLMCREWLLDHYECCDGVSIPRSAMYSHYLDFCAENTLDPLNPAGFGKAVRSIFVHVQTRRLGNRGASKYHYYGLSIKDSSPYSSVLQGTQRVNNLSDYDLPPITPNFHPRTIRLSEDGSMIMLEGFPSIISIPVQNSLKEKVREFLSEYRSHAETVVELVVHTSFTEVKDKLVEFWTTLPDHMTGVLAQDCLVNIIHLCDLAIYKSLAGMLIPSITENIPSNLLTAVRELTENLVLWTQEATAALPTRLQATKLNAANQFRQQMERQCVLCHLIQGVKVTLRDQGLMKQMLCDWLSLDLQLVVMEILERLGEDRDTQTTYHIRKCVRDFEKLLSHRAPLDKFFMLVKNILHNCSAVYIEEDNATLNKALAKVMLNWNVSVSVVLKELTNKETSTFGSFHLLGMLLTDYMMYLIEDRRRALKEVQLKDKVYTGLKSKANYKASMELALSDFTTIAPERSHHDNILAPPSILTATADCDAMATTTSYLAAVPIALESVTDAELSGILAQLSSPKQEEPSPQDSDSFCNNIPPCGSSNGFQTNNKAVKIVDRPPKSLVVKHTQYKSQSSSLNTIENTSVASWEGRRQPSCVMQQNPSSSANQKGPKVYKVKVKDLEEDFPNLKRARLNDLVSGIAARVFKEGVGSEEESRFSKISEQGVVGSVIGQGHHGDRQIGGGQQHVRQPTIFVTKKNLPLLKRLGLLEQRKPSSTETMPVPLERSRNNQLNPVRTGSNRSPNWVEKSQVSSLETDVYRLSTTKEVAESRKLLKVQASPVKDLHADARQQSLSPVYLGHRFNAFREEILQEKAYSGQKTISHVCAEREDLSDNGVASSSSVLHMVEGDCDGECSG